MEEMDMPTLPHPDETTLDALEAYLAQFADPICVGHAGTDCDCPLARFFWALGLEGNGRGWDDVYVTEEEVLLRSGGELAKLPLTPALTAFVLGVDHGREEAYSHACFPQWHTHITAGEARALICQIREEAQ
jgi:hypothetical protein